MSEIIKYYNLPLYRSIAFDPFKFLTDVKIDLKMVYGDGIKVPQEKQW